MSKDLPGVALLYASSGRSCAGCVLIFRQDNGALVGVLAGPLSEPKGMAFDNAGKLFVTDTPSGNPVIFIYPPGAINPSNSLYDPERPVDVAVDDNETVYVSNGGPTASVTVYPNATHFPTSMLLDVNAAQGFGIAVDEHGNVYWGISTKSGFQIDEFYHGAGRAINTGIAPSDVPASLAFDIGNDLVVSQPNVPAVNIYELPHTLSQQIGKTGKPFGIALNRYQRLFVGDQSANQVEEYSYPGGQLVKTFAPPNFSPVGVAVFPTP